MDVKKNKEQLHSWDCLPSEIYLLLFNYVPTSSLAVCMFVSRTWRNHAEHVVEVKKKWGELFDLSQFHLKCRLAFNLRCMYYNYVLWHCVQKATVSLHNVLYVNGFKKISTYRNYLFVVTDQNVRCYEAKTLKKLSTVVHVPCQDFLENDVISVKVFKQGKHLKLHVLTKSASTSVSKVETLALDDVICYKIHNNECYVLDKQNCFYWYIFYDGKWCKQFLARYYGNPNDSRAINVFDNSYYLMLECGSVLGIDAEYGNFVKMTLMPPESQKNIDNMQRVDKKNNANLERIRYKMFFWPYIHNQQVCSRTGPAVRKSLVIERYALPRAGPMQNLDPCIGVVRNISCMLLHSDIMYLGYSDGTVELISSRNLSRFFPNKEPLCRFNVKDFKKDVPEVAVLAIDVYEEEQLQHVFIATNTHILHLHVTHPHGEDYMWSDEVYMRISG